MPSPQSQFTRRAQLTRRALLAGSGVGLAAALTGTGLPVARADEFATLRARYREIIAGPAELDAEDPDIKALVDRLNAPVPSVLNKIDTATDRRRVFTDIELLRSDGFPDARNVTATLTRIETLAYAYATPGGRHTADREVAEMIIAGLQTTHDLAYNADQVEDGDNWWQWEIGSNGRIGRILTLLHDQVPEQLRAALLSAIDHFVPDPGFVYPVDDPRHKAATGANLLDLCYYVAARGILGADAERIAIARDRVGDGFAYASFDPATDPTNALTRDGLYADGSFVQHVAIAYTGSYGVTMLSKTAQLLALLGGSSWEVIDPRSANVIDAVEKAYAPWIFDGAMMSAVRGRAVARSDASDHGMGRGTCASILLFAKGVDADTAKRWRGRVRGWLERDKTREPTAVGGLANLMLIKELLASSARPSNEPAEQVVFPKMDRAVLRRPGWALAIAMSSSRIGRFEVMSDGENKRPWHQGSGATYLYLDGDSAGQFTDGFWPTVDPYRLPGTTVDSRPLEDVLGGSLTGQMMGYGKLTGGSMAGGGFFGDAYRGASHAAIVHHEQGYRHPNENPPPAPLSARMSWFAVRHGVVCLGAGIAGGSGAPIETIVENRRVAIDGNDRWYVNGVEIGESDRPGWSETLTGVKHLTLPGTAGYVFLDGARTVRAKRENRTGSWADIRAGGDPTPITRGYQTAWLDHGPTPEAAGYAWLLSPNATVAQTRALASDPGVEIVANTERAQAVWVPASGYCGVNFYGSGSVSHGSMIISAGQMCSLSALIARPRSGERTEIAVADPTQLANSIMVTVELPPGRPWRLTGADPSVTATVNGSTLTLTADVSGHDGLVRRALLQG